MTLYKYLQEHRYQTAGLIAIHIVNSALQTLGGIASANALTVLVAGHFKTFICWILAMLLAYLLFAAGIYLSIYRLAIIKQRVDTSLRRDISQRIAKSSFAQFHSQPDGTYSSWMSNDLAVINSEAIENFFAIIAAVADVIFASLTLAYFHYSILITVFVLSIAMMLLPKVFKKSLAKASLKRTESNEKLMSEIEDVLEGFNALFMLNARDLIVSKTVAASKKSNQTAENYSNIFARMMAIVNGLSIVSQVIVLAQAGLLIFFKMTAIGAVSAAQTGPK